MTIERHKPVEAGSITNLIRRAFDFLDNMFARWGDTVLEEKDVTTPEGQKAKQITIKTVDRTGGESGYTVYVEFVPHEDDANTVDLRFMTSDGEYKYQKRNIKYSDVDRWINKYCTDILHQGPTIPEAGDEYTDLDPDPKQSDEKDERADTNSSIQVKLRKVTSATESHIDLVAIKSALDVQDTLDAINSLVVDDAFIAELPEASDVSYDVIVNDDGYDVQECDECEGDLRCSLAAMMRAVFSFLTEILWIPHVVVGPNSDKVRNECESMRWEAQSQLDQIMDIFTRTYMECPHPEVAPTYDIDTHCGLDYTAGINMLRDRVNTVLDVYDTYWCNFEHPEQALIDNWINYWKTRSQYLYVATMQV